MKKLTCVALLALVALATGCDKKDAKADPTAAASASSAAKTGDKPAEKAAAPSAALAASAAAPAAGGADDPVVCCKFGGVKGSSTKKLCESQKGTVVPDGECKTLKK